MTRGALAAETALISAWRFVTESCVECGDDLPGGGVAGSPKELCSDACRAVRRRRLQQYVVGPRTKTTGLGRPPKPLPADEVVRRHLAGETITRLRKSFGVKGSRIVACLEDAGVTVRLNAWGAQHQAWKGGRQVDAHGYVWITLAPDDPLREMGLRGAVREHRYVMAVALGRPLRSTETVHHIDGDRQNNALSNLQLRQTAHGEGVVLACALCGSRDLEAIEI